MKKKKKRRTRKKKPVNPINHLLYLIRTYQKYKEWREDVLKRQISTYPKVPKWVQVHHIKPVKTIIQENNLKTLDDALGCEELWNVDNGMILRKNEHMIVTALERQKRFSVGFIRYLKKWISENEDNILIL